MDSIQNNEAKLMLEIYAWVKTGLNVASNSPQFSLKLVNE